MLQISKKQVLKRWDELPGNLREALFSEINANIVWQIGALNHLSEEKISIIAMIVGDVIFGFLHPDDLAREIQETLDLNPQIVNPINHEINRKIFAPLRTDLEKVYSPVSATPEIKPIIKPGPEAKVEKEAAPKPIEITELFKAKNQPPTTLPIAQTSPIIPETQKIPTAQPKAPAEPLKTIPIAPAPSDKPFIIHQETEARPATEKKSAGLPSMGWFKKAAPVEHKTPESPIKVELETFGQKIEEKKEPSIAKTEAPKQRVVHYREVENATPFGKAQGEPFGKPLDTGQDKAKTYPLKETLLLKIEPQKIETPTVKSEPAKPLNIAQNRPFEIELKPKIEFKPEIKVNPIEIAIPKKAEPKIEPAPPLKFEIPVPIIIKEEKPAEKSIESTKPTETIQPSPYEIKEQFKKTEMPPIKTDSPKPFEFEAETIESQKPSETAEPELIDLDPFRVAKWKERETKLDGNTINLKNNNKE